MHLHRDAQFVTVSDETEAPKHFGGVRFGPQPVDDEKATVLVACDDPENGFGWPVGAVVAQLKHLHDNIYGA